MVFYLVHIENPSGGKDVILGCIGKFDLTLGAAAFSLELLTSWSFSCSEVLCNTVFGLAAFILGKYQGTSVLTPKYCTLLCYNSFYP